jgi:steroid delta-isomerase-like uncharacterized protein
MKKIIFIAAIFIFLVFSCKENQQTKENQLKSNLNTVVEQCWNKKDVVKFKVLSAENFVRNVNGIKVANNQNEMVAAMNVFFKGFPDLNITLENTVVKGNQVFTRWIFTGSNTGIFGESPATGKKVKISGYTNAYYTTEGKLYQEDVYFNELDLLQQLGYTLMRPVVE